MSNGHLSEVNIQQYVLDKTGCSGDVIAHMHDCEQCIRVKSRNVRTSFFRNKTTAETIF